MAEKTPRLNWSREPSERGLARVCQPPRGRHGKVAGEVVYRVMPATAWPAREVVGWFWYGRGINTYTQGKVWPTWEEAQADATRHHKTQGSTP
jgi:hypothetical protein